METKWAEENLQTIRTLMERSALYRRALAPIMLFTGVSGVAAATLGIIIHFNSIRAFDLLWLTTAVVVIVGSFLIARRQALSDRENFWSPPTRRVAQALSLPLSVGLILSLLIFYFAAHNQPEFNFISAITWLLFYGCALHSAGFFMPRGIKCFGLLFVLSALFLVFALSENWFSNWLPEKISAHWLMGFFFGGLHLAYGIYLYFTEKKNSVA